MLSNQVKFLFFFVFAACMCDQLIKIAKIPRQRIMVVVTLMLSTRMLHGCFVNFVILSVLFSLFFCYFQQERAPVISSIMVPASKRSFVCIFQIYCKILDTDFNGNGS